MWSGWVTYVQYAQVRSGEIYLCHLMGFLPPEKLGREAAFFLGNVKGFGVLLNALTALPQPLTAELWQNFAVSIADIEAADGFDDVLNSIGVRSITVSEELQYYKLYFVEPSLLSPLADVLSLLAK